MKSLNRDQIGTNGPTFTRFGSLVVLGLPLLTVLGWGGSFPVAKAALPHVNAFYLTAERYLFASLIFAAILWLAEGKRALRFDGRFLRLFALGSIGFAGFGLFAFLGLAHTQPQNAALLVATMPLLTVLVLWARGGTKPSGATIGFMVAALAGVALVITRGSLSLITSGQVGGWDLMVLFGVLCWVIYTLGANSLSGWSPLRYTTLSALAGTLTILTVTAVATAVGYVSAPSLHETIGATWEIAFMVIPAAVVAVLTWNAGIKRLGPQNTVLFINLVPIITLGIEIMRGYQVVGVEILGVTVTVVAVVGNNLWQRRTAPADISMHVSRTSAA